MKPRKLTKKLTTIQHISWRLIPAPGPYVGLMEWILWLLNLQQNYRTLRKYFLLITTYLHYLLTSVEFYRSSRIIQLGPGLQPDVELTIN